MNIIEHTIVVPGRGHEISIVPLGDVHIGALNCDEAAFRREVKRIKDDPNCYWVGGGDYLDAVIINDVKRFDVGSIPDWMLRGKPEEVKHNLGDMVNAQIRRFLKAVEPIKDKCIGLIAGNHEGSISKYHNRSIMRELCEELDVPNLTYSAFIRLRFERHLGDNVAIQNLLMYMHHGAGGGRTAGAEPNKIDRMVKDKLVDIVLTGHTHSFYIHPPVVYMTIPTSGKLPDIPVEHETHAANWGCFVRTMAKGPSSYSEVAAYPARAFYNVTVKIKTFITKKVGGKSVDLTQVNMEKVKL